MKYFDGVQNIIEAYSGDKLIPLDDCPKTIDFFLTKKLQIIHTGNWQNDLEYSILFI